MPLPARDSSKLPCESCGRARAPAPGVEQYTKSCTFGCGFPLPHANELDALFLLRSWINGLRLDYLGEKKRRTPLLEAIASEIERLRAERQPFKLVIDAALEAGVAEGKCDRSVLELAQRLGFRLPDLRDAATSNSVVLVNGVRCVVESLNLNRDSDGTGSADVRLVPAERPIGWGG